MAAGKQLHGNLTPAHADGCAAQCFEGVQCASIYSSYSKPDCSDGGATLFLTGADHGYCEIKRRTRQINLPSATMSLQVVIVLCKRKETAALKIKAAVS